MTTLEVSRMQRSESASMLHYTYICYHFFTCTINVIILKFLSVAAAAAEPVPHGSGETSVLVYSWLPEEEISSARSSIPSPFQQRTPRNLLVAGVMDEQRESDLEMV